MPSTACALFAGTFAVLFAPALHAQEPSRGAAALLVQGTASIQFAAAASGEEPPAEPGERALLGRQSGVRLCLEPADRRGRDPDPAVRGLLGR